MPFIEKSREDRKVQGNLWHSDRIKRKKWNQLKNKKKGHLDSLKDAVKIH